MNNNKQQFDMPATPRPIRAEWERTIASIRPWLSAEKFQEAEKIHWRMFERAKRWFEPGGSPARGENLR